MSRATERSGRAPAGARRGERGAILVMTALVSVALILFAAMSVDVGIQRAKRAQFQAVADGAALLAIYQINNGYTIDQTATNVKAYVLRNIGIGTAAWAGCEDVKALEDFAVADQGSANECISFDLTPGAGQSNLARVKLPVEEWSPIFGMGIVTQRISAVAGAEGAQGVCDEFDLAGCTTTTTTTAPPTTTTTLPPPPACPAPNQLFWDPHFWTWDCAPPAPTCNAPNMQWWSAWWNSWECVPPAPYCNLATSAQWWDEYLDQWVCDPYVTTTTTYSPTTGPPPTSPPTFPPTSIEIEF